MEIQLPPSLVSTPTATKGISSLLAQLRPGQHITAVVEAQLGENSFLLKLADSGQFLRARSQLDLAAGQPLKLEVVKFGTTPELRVVPQLRGDAPQTALVQQVLREFLPKQRGLAELTSTLQQALAQQSVKNITGLPESLRTLIKTVLEAFPQKRTLLTAEGLRQAVRDSGVFFEARLAAQASAPKDRPAGDLKSRLLALHDVLQVLLITSEADPVQPAATPPRDAGFSAEKALSTSPAEQSDGAPTQAGPPSEDGEAANKAAIPRQAVDGRELASASAKANPVGTNGPNSLQPKQGHESPELAHSTPPAKTPESSKSQAVPSPPTRTGMGSTDGAADSLKPNQEATDAHGEPGAARPGARQSPDKLNTTYEGDKANAGDIGAKKPAAGKETSVASTLSASGAKTGGGLPRPASPELEFLSRAEIGPRHLTSEPPDASPATASDVNRQPGKPPPVDGANAGVNIRSEQGPRSDQPLSEDGAGRSGLTSPSLQDPTESLVSLRSLQQHTEGALARIVLDQLASLPQGDGKQLVWQLEIPFADDRRWDSAKLKIVREGTATGAQSGQAYWSVILEVSPPGLGTIHSRIALWGERVDTYFWSDLDSTSALIQDHLDLLAARMQQVGLEIGQLCALPGMPPEKKVAAPLPAKLVDERA